MGKNHSLVGDSVNVGTLIEITAGPAQVDGSKIINQDEQDVWSPSRICRLARNQWQDQLTHYWEDRRNELYNLKADIGEKVDVAKENPEITRDLGKELDNWLTQSKARIPTPSYDRIKLSANYGRL